MKELTSLRIICLDYLLMSLTNGKTVDPSCSQSSISQMYINKKVHQIRTALKLTVEQDAENLNSNYSVHCVQTLEIAKVTNIIKSIKESIRRYCKESFTIDREFPIPNPEYVMMRTINGLK